MSVIIDSSCSEFAILYFCLLCLSGGGLDGVGNSACRAFWDLLMGGAWVVRVSVEFAPGRFSVCCLSLCECGHVNFDVLVMCVL